MFEGALLRLHHHEQEILRYELRYQGYFSHDVGRLLLRIDHNTGMYCCHRIVEMTFVVYIT